MKFKNYKLVIALIVFLLPVVVSAQVIGQEGLSVAAGRAQFGTETDIYTIVTRWINGFLSIFMMVFTYFIITAGFNWMTSGGNAEKIDAAKKTLKYALIGMVVAFVSYALARYVMLALGTTTGIVDPATPTP